MKRFPISQTIYYNEDPTIDALQSLIGNDLQEKRGVPMSIANDKRATRRVALLYGKRSSMPSFFDFGDAMEDGNEAITKRAVGEFYGKRSNALRLISQKLNGGIYG